MRVDRQPVADAAHQLGLGAVGERDRPEVGDRHEGVAVAEQRQHRRAAHQEPGRQVPGQPVEQRQRALAGRGGSPTSAIHSSGVSSVKSARRTASRPISAPAPACASQERRQHVRRPRRELPERRAEARRARARRPAPAPPPAAARRGAAPPARRASARPPPAARPARRPPRPPARRSRAAAPARRERRRAAAAPRPVAAAGEPGRDEARPDLRAAEGAVQEQDRRLLGHASTSGAVSCRMGRRLSMQYRSLHQLGDEAWPGARRLARASSRGRISAIGCARSVSRSAM